MKHQVNLIIIKKRFIQVRHKLASFQRASNKNLLFYFESINIFTIFLFQHNMLLKPCEFKVKRNTKT